MDMEDNPSSVTDSSVPSAPSTPNPSAPDLSRLIIGGGDGGDGGVEGGVGRGTAKAHRSVLSMLSEYGEEGTERALLLSMLCVSTTGGGEDTPMTPAAVASMRLSGTPVVSRLLSPASSPTVSVALSGGDTQCLRLWQFRALEAQKDNEQLRDEVLGLQARHMEEREVMSGRLDSLQHEKDELEMQLHVLQQEWERHMALERPPVTDSGCQTVPVSTSTQDCQTDAPSVDSFGVQTDPPSVDTVSLQTDPPSVDSSGMQTDPPSVDSVCLQTDPPAVDSFGMQTEPPAAFDAVAQTDTPLGVEMDVQTDPVTPDVAEMEVQTEVATSHVDVQTDTTDDDLEMSTAPVASMSIPPELPTAPPTPPTPTAAVVVRHDNGEDEDDDDHDNDDSGGDEHGSHTTDDDDGSDSEFEDQSDEDEEGLVVHDGVEETKAADRSPSTQTAGTDGTEVDEEDDGEGVEVWDQQVQTTPEPGSLEQTIFELQQMLISTKVALADALTDGQTGHLRIKEYEQMLLQAKLQLATTRETSEDRLAELELLRQQRREWIQSPASSAKPKKSMRARAASVFGLRQAAGASPKVGR